MAMQSTRRSATPARWQAALGRAVAGGVQVRQLAGCGQWVATSATDPAAAYEVAVTAGIAHGCSCAAAQHGDPICCHRAAFYAAAGVLELAAADPAPEPPTPATPAVCGACGGRGFEPDCTGHPTAAGRVWCECSRCGGRAPALPAPRPIIAVDFAPIPLAA
jgi:hypothetical protein